MATSQTISFQMQLDNSDAVRKLADFQRQLVALDGPLGNLAKSFQALGLASSNAAQNINKVAQNKAIDEISKASNKAAGNFDILSASADRASEALDRVKKSSKGARDGLEQVKKGQGEDLFQKINKNTIGAIQGAIGKLTSAFGAARSAFNAIFDIGEKAAKASDAQVLFESIGGSIDRLRAVSKGAIDDFTLMSKFNFAHTMGIQAHEFEKMVSIARAASINLGESFDYTLDSIVRGVARGSALILDNLGIRLKVGEANEKYAKSIGKTVKQLTAEEKTQAILNETMIKGAEIVADFEKSGAGAALSFQQMTAQIENTKNAIAAELLPIIQKTLPVIKDLISYTREILGIEGIKDPAQIAIDKAAAAADAMNKMDRQISKLVADKDKELSRLKDQGSGQKFLQETADFYDDQINRLKSELVGLQSDFQLALAAKQKLDKPAVAKSRVSPFEDDGKAAEKAQKAAEKAERDRERQMERAFDRMDQWQQLFDDQELDRLEKQQKLQEKATEDRLKAIDDGLERIYESEEKAAKRLIDLQMQANEVKYEDYLSLQKKTADADNFRVQMAEKLANEEAKQQKKKLEDQKDLQKKQGEDIAQLGQGIASTSIGIIDGLIQDSIAGQKYAAELALANMLKSIGGQLVGFGTQKLFEAAGLAIQGNPLAGPTAALGGAAIATGLGMGAGGAGISAAISGASGASSGAGALPQTTIGGDSGRSFASSGGGSSNTQPVTITINYNGGVHGDPIANAKAVSTAIEDGMRMGVFKASRLRIGR